MKKFTHVPKNTSDNGVRKTRSVKKAKVFRKNDASNADKCVADETAFVTSFGYGTHFDNN
jgi:hypothetical protein